MKQLLSQKHGVNKVCTWDDSFPCSCPHLFDGGLGRSASSGTGERRGNGVILMGLLPMIPPAVILSVPFVIWVDRCCSSLRCLRYLCATAFPNLNATCSR